MNEKEFFLYLKTLRPIKKRLSIEEFVKKLKKIYFLNFKNVYFVLKNRTYYKDNGYFLNMLRTMFNVEKKIEKVG